MSANTNLGNTPVNQGYVQLIHTGDTGGITTSLQALYDGDGTASDLLLASNKVRIATSFQIGTSTAVTGILDENNMASNSDVKLATQQSIKAYVDTEVAGIVSSAPSTLDTLDELASALGDDANYATTTATALGTKLVKGSNLSDLTNATTARSNLGLGALAVLGTVNASTITDNSVGAAELNVSGNGTTSQFLRSDSDGTFTWATPTDTNTQLSTEAVQDIVGGMLGGTETRITVDYDDTNGRINFVVDDIAGTITSVSNMSNNRVLTASGGTTINGESNLTFDGSTGLLLLNQDSNAEAFKVTGGGGGSKIASFIRDVGVSSPYAEAYIHASGADPQMTFRSSANQYFSMGIDLSASSFKISEHSSIATDDRLVIDTSGNVGIGIASPSSKTEISHVQNAESLLTLHNNRQDASNVPIFGIAGKQSGTIVGKMSFYRGGGGNSGYMTFSTKVDNSTALSEKMRLDGSGILCIGHTSGWSSTKLDLGTSGSMRTGERLYFYDSNRYIQRNGNDLDYYSNSGEHNFTGNVDTTGSFKMDNTDVMDTNKRLVNLTSAVGTDRSGGTHIVDFATPDTPGSTGWYTICKANAVNARGGGIINISVTGGSMTPTALTIDFMFDWSGVMTATTKGHSGQLTKIRAIETGSTTELQIYVNTTVSQALYVSFERNRYNPNFSLLSTWATATPSSTQDEILLNGFAIGLPTSGMSVTIPRGYLGVNTNTPAHAIDVSGNIRNFWYGSAIARVESTAGGYGAYSRLTTTTNSYDLVSLNGDFLIDESGVATRFVIKDSTGNIGVGATNPLRKLHVVGSLAVNEATDQYYGVLLGGGEGNDPKITIGDWHNSSGSIMWDSSENVLKIDSQHSTANRDIVFTGNDGATEYMRVKSTGLGIGITPAEVLDLKSSSGDCRIRLDAPNGSDTEIKFFNAGAAVWTLGHDDGSGAFRLGTTNVDSGVAINVATGGHIGINETSPTTELHLGTCPDARAITFDQSGRFNGIGNYYSSNATDSYVDIYCSDGGTNGDTNSRMKIYADGRLKLTNSNNVDMLLAKATQMGYSSSYRALVIGETSGNFTNCIGYDPSGNSSGSFTGDGREVIFRNGAEFTTPNSANNGFHNDILCLKDGKVGISTASPGNLFTVNSTSAYQASIQYDASTRLRISVEGSGRARFYTDNNANVGIESGGFYVQPTQKLFLDGGNDTFIKESSANVMEFYCGNSRRMQLTTTYLQVPDNAYLAAGDNNEVFIRHDGNGHFQSNGGQMYINNVATTNIIISVGNDEKVRIENDGDLHVKADVVAYSSTPSDIRLKKNFTKIDNGLDVISKLDGQTFNWKKDEGRLSAGFKAQEVEQILPHLVDERELPLHSDDNKDYKVLRYEEIIPYLVEAIKEQQEQINELKGIING